MLYACTLYHNGLSMNAQWRAEAYVHRTVKVESRLQFDRDKSQPLSHKIELQASAKLCGRLLAKKAASQAGRKTTQLPMSLIKCACTYILVQDMYTYLGNPKYQLNQTRAFFIVDNNNWHLNRVYLSAYKNCDNAQSIYYFFITLYSFPALLRIEAHTTLLTIVNRVTHFSIIFQYLNSL